VGPFRVLPGRLSVSRTFGDLEAKTPKYGGNPNVIIAVPEIRSFKISSHHDFVGISSDGVTSKISNVEFIKCVWNSVNDSKAPNIH
jgi:protein phosphatase PTC2/3